MSMDELKSNARRILPTPPKKVRPPIPLSHVAWGTPKAEAPMDEDERRTAGLIALADLYERQEAARKAS